MIIIFKGWYFAGIAGLGLAVYGSVETKLALEAASEPEAISIADLERGLRPAQPFVRVDRHQALYQAVAYQAKRDRIRDAAYPILSLEHPWCLAWNTLIAAHGDRAAVPDSEKPAPPGFSVVVHTDRFKTVDDIPQDRVEDGDIGIVYGFEDLSSKEKDLLRAVSRPLAEQVVVLDLGRRPKPIWLGLVLCAVGLLLSGWASFLFFRKKDEEADEGSTEA